MTGAASIDLHVDGLDLPGAIAELEGEAGLDRPDRYRIRYVTPSALGLGLGLGEAEDEAIGRTAVLGLHGAGGSRFAACVVTGIERLGVDGRGSGATYAVELASPLALLEHRFGSRVHQEISVPDLATRLLEEWGIPVRRALVRTYPAWPYCVQYEETDLAFLLRVLAAEGIFCFAQPGTEPTGGFALVLGDSPRAYLTEAAGTPLVLGVGGPGSLDEGAESVTALARRRRLSTARARLRDHNPDAPQLDVLAEAEVAGGEERAVHTEFLPARSLVGAPDRPASDALEALRRGAVVLSGSSTSRRLAPGRVLAVPDAADASLGAPMVVTAVRIRAHLPGVSSRTDEPFVCAFDALPATVVARPARPAWRRAPGLDSATVVGPRDQEVHTDSLGRVRVRFRWDYDRPSSGSDSCWLRVAQGWAGPGYGSFALPRVGMEVLVGYLGGDPNRPIVVGCVPNGQNPPPFRMPADATRSGVVTRSSPGGATGSELVFEDAIGNEQVRLRSSRDVELRAHRDGSLAAGNDLDVRAVAELRTRSRVRREDVEDELATSVAGRTSADLHGPVQLDLRAPLAVALASESVVSSRADVRIATERAATVSAERAFEVRAGAELLLRADRAALVQVGTPEHAAPFLVHATGGATMESPRAVELRSDTEIRLSCGDSTLVVGPKSVQILTKKLRVDAETLEGLVDTANVRASEMLRLEGDKVYVLSSGASLALVDDARIKGSKVKLGAAPDSTQAPEPLDAPPPPTRIVMVDGDGAPLAGVRFVVRLEDGTERIGVLDAEGRASLRGIEGSATISFPDLPEWEAS